MISEKGRALMQRAKEKKEILAQLGRLEELEKEDCPQTIKRDLLMTVCVSLAERVGIRAMAGRYGLTVSEYIRRVALGQM